MGAPRGGTVSTVRPQSGTVRARALQGSRIVGFEVEPSSVKHAFSGQWRGAETPLTTCGGTASAVPLSMAGGGEVIFTCALECSKACTSDVTRDTCSTRATRAQTDCPYTDRAVSG